MESTEINCVDVSICGLCTIYLSESVTLEMFYVFFSVLLVFDFLTRATKCMMK